MDAKVQFWEGVMVGSHKCGRFERKQWMQRYKCREGVRWWEDTSVGGLKGVMMQRYKFGRE